MSHWINLSFSEKPCGYEGFFTAKHVPRVPRQLCQWRGLGLQWSWTFIPPRLSCYLLEQWQYQLQKPTQEGIALLWFPGTHSAAFHLSSVTCDWAWGVPVSDPKILRGALPFVKQMNYTTKDCHILEAYWHNWDFNPHFALHLFKE